MRPILAAVALASLALPVAAPAQAGVSIAGFETDGSVGLARAEYQAIGRALGALLGARLGSASG
ncbi:MAG: hypothetical protein H6691_06775, partial [Gemmatimonadales bacterium]|nr:hypothetical protein [Gemmatimonadales bacterium]